MKIVDELLNAERVQNETLFIFIIYFSFDEISILFNFNEKT
jgi:hypothetical protein